MSAARRSSSTARRSLLTATAAGTMLAALWFVPSANASQDVSQESTSTMTDSSAVARTSTDTAATTEHTAARAADTASETTAGTGGGTATQTLEGPAGTRLADTGSIDTTPYVVGGTLLLGLGAGFVAYSVRRERTAAY
ncbi:LPXTG cell wall anchor domain-containing protein [Streptomyces sp. NBC_00670]|uniref:LPXTG cell wall anchor domain-containing protein n=1 Tax=Streptomyces sp. NBC_00670 TaxID=2975804 RepID=UPI002E324D77|nr:LPXTG cell wall anchor domain-containing protein [Streptomyces sp. NBC_00670]